MKKLIFVVLAMLAVLLVSAPAMADVTRVTGTGPKLVVTGQNSVITAIWSVTISGAATINIQPKAQTYTTAATPVWEGVVEAGGTDFKNKFINLSADQTYHVLENTPSRQWNNGIESNVPKFVGIEAANGIVFDFGTTTGTAYIFYEKKALKQDDVNFTNAE